MKKTERSSPGSVTKGLFQVKKNENCEEVSHRLNEIWPLNFSARITAPWKNILVYTWEEKPSEVFISSPSIYLFKKLSNKSKEIEAMKDWR